MIVVAIWCLKGLIGCSILELMEYHIIKNKLIEQKESNKLKTWENVVKCLIQIALGTITLWISIIILVFSIITLAIIG